MTATDVIEFVQKFWLQFLLTTVSGVLAWKCKKWYKESEEQKKERKAEEGKAKERSRFLEEGVLAILHDRLLQSMTFFLRKKEITSDELDNIRSMYEAYTALGGNGTIKILYDRFVKYVRIVPPDYLE